MPSTIVSDRSRFRRMLDGAMYMPRGIVLFFRRPGLWLLGLTPVAISAALVVGLTLVLGFWLDDFIALVTPFADAWPGWIRGAVRISIGIAIVAAIVLLIFLTFAEVTNIVGQPFFEILSQRIESERGSTFEGDPDWWKNLPKATLESTVAVCAYVLCAIPLFVASFIPVVGQFVIPVVGAVVTGWFLALEILQIPLERRGHGSLSARIRFQNDARFNHEVLGFGIAAFLLFLIPLANVVAMPGAIIGATLLVRRLHGDDPA